MHIDGSCRCLLRPSVNQTLAWMARGVEDGDVSDGDSLEEITAEDFRQDARGSRSRVLVPDTMSYTPSTSLTSDPNCFAWSPAVGNKPLGFGGKSVGSVGPDSAMGEPCVVVIEDSSEDSCSEVEEEEGELEEAEIDLGSELAAGGVIELEDESEVKGSGETGSGEKQLEEMGNFDKSMKRILQDLGMITAGEAEPSIDAVCSQLQKMFADSRARVPIVGSLAQQAFMGVQTVHSVATSAKSMKVEPKEVLLLRLLLHIKDNFSGVLAPELLKEINAMVQYWASKCAEKGISPHYCSSLETPYPEPRAVNSVVSNGGKAGLPKWETPIAVRNRVELNPLLDHDADDIHGNLPSPSREKPIGFGTGAVIATRPMAPKNGETEGYALRRAYDNHAFRVVSSYHLKHSPTSFLGSNQLPSPTPSDECDDVEDAHGEVSSSWIGDNARTLNSASSLQLQMASNVMAKSRHPRLRILNPEVVGTPDPNRRSMHVDPNAPNGLAREIVDSRKHKAVDDVQVDHVLKRQRNGFKDSQPREMIRLNGNVEFKANKIENGEIVSCETVTANINGTNGGIMKNTSMSTAPAVQLPSLLKDISVNHTRLMQLIKTKQHELAAQAQQKTADPAHDATFFSIANRLTRTVSSANGGSMKSSEVEQNPAVKPQLPSLTASMNDVGRTSVKSRDPRGILQRVSLNSEPTKINGNLSSDTSSSNELFVVRDKGEQAQMACLASQNTAQPIQSKISKVDAKSSTADSNGHMSASAFLCQGCTKGTSQAPNQWEDVNHLLDGFDDQERAAVWKERARRIEEQYKMFAERKLCLVLDLDHTLLNSAKFEDIDPVQYEKLMKREEKECHKPDRHLFRLQHMGMWTKLRPGIWKFLERASKLYELHLYTMGNKLYATEMAKVLDPTGNLFAGRVISRGHVGDAPDGDERASRIKDLDGVLGMESAVVIIDDSVRVWPYNKLNLIAVERYLYFPCSRRQFGLRGPSLLEIGHDERAENGTLASSLAVIERIHHNFFSHGSLDDADVRNMLAAEQRKILAGCRIVFSRIFPVGEAEPQLHPLWQTAQQFGAFCTNQIDEQVTHVVANSPGTDKVNWALSAGRFVVKPGWVEASALLYRRANELHFAIKL